MTVPRMVGQHQGLWWMYRGQFFLPRIGYRVLRRLFVESEYRVLTHIITARIEWSSGLSL